MHPPLAYQPLCPSVTCLRVLQALVCSTSAMPATCISAWRVQEGFAHLTGESDTPADSRSIAEALYVLRTALRRHVVAGLSLELVALRRGHVASLSQYPKLLRHQRYLQDAS